MGGKQLESVKMRTVGADSIDSVCTKGEATLNNVISFNNRLNEGVGQFRTVVALTDVKATLSTAFSEFKKQLKEAKATLTLVTGSDGDLRVELDVKVDVLPETLRKGYEAATGLVENITKIIKETPEIKKQVEDLAESLKALTPDKMKADLEAAGKSGMELISSCKNAGNNVEELARTPKIFEQLVATCQDAAKQIQEGMSEAKANAETNVANAKAAVEEKKA